jgi:hypothetical protein
MLLGKVGIDKKRGHGQNMIEYNISYTQLQYTRRQSQCCRMLMTFC